MNNNYNLTYPLGTDFYDINVFNSNFSRLADGVDEAKNRNFKAYTVVASENTPEVLKKNADYICGKNATEALQNAINATESGGRILLLTGNYSITSTLVVNKPLYITGYGNSTVLQQAAADSVKSIFKLTAEGSILEKLRFADASGNSNEDMLSVQNVYVVIRDCWFEQIRGSAYKGAGCIGFNNSGCLAMISGCVFARSNGDDNIVINCNKTEMAGYIANNYCFNQDGYFKMPIKIKLYSDNSKNRLVVDSLNTVIVTG